MRLATLVQAGMLLFLALLMTACSSKPSTFVAAPQAADRDAVVYIYRPSSSSNFMLSPAVVIDGDEKFKIGNGDYRYVYLPAGEHTVGLNPTGQYTTDSAMTLRVEAGNSYYLRVNTLLKFEKETMNTRKFWIDTVAEEEAQMQIANTGYAGPQQQTTEQARAADGSEGFSVDKTQDPFAGKYE